MLLAIEMVTRYYSREEVVGLLDSEELQDMDDPQEVVMEGSDEEFEDPQDLDEIENGIGTDTKSFEYHYLLCRYRLRLQCRGEQ